MDQDQSIVSKLRLLARRIGTRGLLALVIVIAGAWGALYFLDGARCSRTAERRHALRLITGYTDEAGERPLSRRFASRNFRCTDSESPRGVVIGVPESTGDYVVWFVDSAGTAHNVNLMAAAWTPTFPGAGRIPVELMEQLK